MTGVIRMDQSRELFTAAETDDAAALERLIGAGADVDAKREDGKTALMLAAEGGHTAALETLLKAGADVNAEEEDGEQQLGPLAVRKRVKRAVKTVFPHVK